LALAMEEPSKVSARRRAIVKVDLTKPSREPVSHGGAELTEVDRVRSLWAQCLCARWIEMSGRCRWFQTSRLTAAATSGGRKGNTGKIERGDREGRKERIGRDPACSGGGDAAGFRVRARWPDGVELSGLTAAATFRSEERLRSMRRALTHRSRRRYQVPSIAVLAALRLPLSPVSWFPLRLLIPLAP
jgi:hypothetical protein